MNCSSESGMVQFYADTTLHLVSELSEFWCLSTVTWAKVAFLTSSIFWVRLAAETRSCVKRLISIRSSLVIVSSSCFWQGPSWEVVVVWSVSRRFRYVPARTHAMWCRDQVLQCHSSSVTETKLFRCVINWLLYWLVLRSRISFILAALEPWLSSDFWSKTSSFPVNICLNWIIKEKCILVEIVFGFVLSNSDLGTHWPIRCLINTKPKVKTVAK